MLLRGNTTPTPSSPSSPTASSLHLHYYYYYYSTTSDFITVPSQLSTLLHLVLLSRALWTVRCCQARTERRREADRREEVWSRNKIKALLFVPETWRCTHSSTITWQCRSTPSPLYILFMVSLLMCPVVCFSCFWLVQELCCSCYNELLVTSEAEGNVLVFLFFLTMNWFLSVIRNKGMSF